MSVSKKDLIEKVAEIHGNKALTTKIINDLFTQIEETLATGETVDIFGFGKFEVKQREAREAINPLTKEKITVPAKKALTFKASKSIKTKINN